MSNSNICRKPEGSPRVRAVSLLPVCVLWAGLNAFALDPNRAVSEYLYDEWGSEQGLVEGGVHAVAQTPDGYLWLACDKGLVRFNGFSFRSFTDEKAPGLTPGPVQELAVDSEGNLWVRKQDMALLRYRKGKFEDVMAGVFGPGRGGATAMSSAQQKQVMFWSGAEAVTCCRPDSLMPSEQQSSGRGNLLVISMAQAAGGKLWLGSRDSGLLVLANRVLTNESAGLPDLKVNALLTAEAGQLWIGTDNGAVRWDGSRLTRADVPAALERGQITALTRDREANIWVGTADGLYRVDARGEAAAVQADRISEVNAITEDREGNIWVGMHAGLARLRESAFLEYPFAKALRSMPENGPIYAAADGRTWYSRAGGSVEWRRGEQTGVVNLGPESDTVYSIAGGNGKIWVGRKQGLSSIACAPGCSVERTYTQADGLAQDAVLSLRVASNGALWAGTVNGGVSKLAGGRFQTFTSESGLAANTIYAIAEARDGALWFGTSDGLSSLREGSWRTYGAADGVPPGSVNCLAVDQAGVLWIGTARGLAVRRSGKIEPVRWTPRLPEEDAENGVLGLLVDDSGTLLIATAKHVFRVDRQHALSGRISAEDARQFDGSDGLPAGFTVRRDPILARDSLGRIWISRSRGIAVGDPARLARELVPAIAHVESVSADGAPLRLAGTVEVPAMRRRVVFNFIGVSLAVPQRVRYRYKLEDFDRDWIEPAGAREAVYTNLSPGAYRFRVRASNLEGRWQAGEDSVRVRVEPAFWQTWWFRMWSAFAVLLAVAAFYQMRFRQIRGALDLAFKERLAERTRIAQELHDTLLQGFLSASMQVHVALGRLADESTARAPLKRAAELMRKASEEGRAALRELRSGEVEASLEHSLSEIPREVAMADGTSFLLRAEGHSRPLQPLARDEIYRIGREAILNAIHHSGANKIEVEVSYHAQQLRLAVQDDGRGIGRDTLEAGRDGHWGLQGMRERAERIGAKLSLLSSPGAGTELILTVPEQMAFQASGQPSRGLRIRNLWSRMKRVKPGRKKVAG